MCHVCGKGFLDSNYNQAVIDKILTFHDIAPNFTYSQKWYFGPLCMTLFKTRSLFVKAISGSHVDTKNQKTKTKQKQKQNEKKKQKKNEGTDKQKTKQNKYC